MRDILSNYDKIKLGIIVLLVASLPFYLFISSILVISGVLLTVLKVNPFNRFDHLRLSPLSVLLMVYFVLELIGLAYTDRENIHTGWFNLEKHLGLIFIPFIFWDMRITLKQRHTLLFIFAISCLAGTLVCVVGNIFESLIRNNVYFDEWRFSHERLAEPIGISPVYFAMYLSFAAFALLNYLKENHKGLSGLKKMFLFVILLYFFLFIISLGARTIAVVFLLVVLFNMLRFSLKQRSYIMLLLSALVPVLFVGLILFHPIVKTRFLDVMKGQYENTNYGSYFARSKIWGPGLEVIRENILFGVGTGDDQVELDKKYLKFDYLEGVKVFNMHNQYLQSWLSIGILGLFTFISILFVQVREAYSKRDLLYISFLTLFAMACLTESMLCTHKGIVFFLVLSFIFYRSVGKNEQEAT